MPQGVEHHREHRSPDELDGLLRAYFRAEMPDPWPRAPGHVPPRRVPTPGWQRWHRHLALAAAVSFFLLGSFLLTRGFPEGKEKATPGVSLPGAKYHLGLKPDRPKTTDPHKLQMLPLETTPTPNGRPVRSYGFADPQSKIGVYIAK